MSPKVTWARALCNLASTLALASILILAGCGHTRPADPPPGKPTNAWQVVLANQVGVRSEPGTPSQLPRSVVRELDRVGPLISRDFKTYPSTLRVMLFASHRSFARALWSLQRRRPQGALDNTSSIVHGALLLGPAPRQYLQHNLAHVYTEWVIDRLTGNRLDALPPDTWLYDGLAEFEAYRYAPAGMRCAVRAQLPFDITSVRTARRWLELRAGPWGALEYCLAYIRVRTIVARVGWSAIVRLLRQPGGWSHFARALHAT